jgi:hypothetical protein
MAQHAGVSDAVFFESVVRNLHETLTDRGLPTWWPLRPRTMGSSISTPP